MKGKNAYFTVEAVLVFPLALSAILVVIFLLIYQYNRCIQEQDAGAMALWGCAVEQREELSIETLIQDKMQELYRGKYVAWEIERWDASLKGNEFCVAEEGSLTFSVPGWNMWNKENVWKAETEYCFERLDEVSFIRLCNRFLNKEKDR